MRFAILSLFAVLVPTALAQSIVGTYEEDSDMAIQTVPNDEDLSGNATPDVNVIGPDVIPASSSADDLPAQAFTTTQCWSGVDTGTSSARIAVFPSIVNGAAPEGIDCYIVYTSGGGVHSSPLPHTATSSTNRNITVVLPVVVSLVGLLALIGAFVTYKRIRSKRLAETRREWVNRPGGWAASPGAAESGKLAAPAPAVAKY